jgi:outer membrane receptor protein involved in Fe transport
VSDLEGELGISDASASDDSWRRGYLRAAGSLRVLPFLEPTLVASFTRDEFEPHDPLAFSMPPRPSGRSTEALALEARLYGRLGDTFVELRPSARLAFSQTAIAGETLNAPDRGGDDVSATYRVAALIAPWPALSFSASAATGVRLPSILELFGDRVYQLPNPTLVPERSKTADASVVLRGRLGALRGSAELRGFALFIDDLIRYERTAQFTARPENIASGRILGLEFGLQGTYGRHLSLVSSLTALATRNQFGKALPFRPPLELLVRPELVLYPPIADRAALFAELEHVAFTYLDEANRTFLDGRSLLGVGAALSLLDDRVVVQARVANLLDDLATDVLSHPLPGREFLLSLTVQDGE